MTSEFIKKKIARVPKYFTCQCGIINNLKVTELLCTAVALDFWAIKQIEHREEHKLYKKLAQFR